MKYLLGAVQVFAMATALAFVVLLFVLQPDESRAPAAVAASGATATTARGATPTAGPVATVGVAATTPAAPAIDAAARFEDDCSGCHGTSGEGLTAPKLSDGRAAARFPDIEAQVAVVRDGRNAMPGFADRMSEDEIRAIVRYTRTL